MFLYWKFIHDQKPLKGMPEADLLQALDEFSAVHPHTEASLGAEDHPEPSQDDPMDIIIPDDTQQCGWMDEATHRKCLAFVPTGLQSMLLHLNTAHDVSGSEKESKECRWAVLRSGYEYACGKKFQRRNVPRHVATHLGVRYACDLCNKHFSRSDLLKSHERKDHEAQDNCEIDAKLHS
jgi:hypothetical protein